MLVQILQIRLVWSKIAYGKLNFYGNVVFVRRFVACANIAPHQSARVIIQHGKRYVEFFSLLGDQIFGSVHSAFSDFRFDIRSGSVFSFEKCESLVSTMFRQQAAKYPCVPSGGPWCVSFEVSVKVYGHMSHSSVSTRTPNSCRIAPLNWISSFL